MTEPSVARTQRERTRLAYDRVASSYAAALPDTRAETAMDLAMISEFVGRVSGRTVLDAGCGTGRMAAHMLGIDPSLELTGIDQSSAMLEHARAAVPGVPFLLADLAQLPFAAATFDGVLAWYSIIHTPPSGLRAVLAELRRVVSARGCVLVGFQSGSGERPIRSAYGHEVDLMAYLFTVDEMRAALEDSGFAVSVCMERAPVNETHSQASLLAVAS